MAWFWFAHLALELELSRKWVGLSLSSSAITSRKNLYTYNIRRIKMTVSK